jgi:predicted glycosyltransferase
MPAERREAIGSRTVRLDSVSRQDFSDDMMSLMDAADVVVSMGGYNTVCELLTLKKRAVVVPRVRPVQEQGIRAERMAALGLLRTVHPDRLTPQHLLETVQQEVLATLHGNGENPTSLLLDGLDEVARAIFRLIGFKGPELATVRGEALPTFTRNIPTWRNSPTTAVPSASW